MIVNEKSVISVFSTAILIHEITQLNRYDNTTAVRFHLVPLLFRLSEQLLGTSIQPNN